MVMPALHTNAGRILAFLDSEEGAGEWTTQQMAERLGLKVSQVITVCSSQCLEGRIVRVGTGNAVRYTATPHYPRMPAPPWLAKEPRQVIVC